MKKWLSLCKLWRCEGNIIGCFQYAGYEGEYTEIMRDRRNVEMRIKISLCTLWKFCGVWKSRRSYVKMAFIMQDMEAWRKTMRNWLSLCKIQRCKCKNNSILHKHEHLECKKAYQYFIIECKGR